MSEIQHAYFAVPPIAIPISEDPLVIYGRKDEADLKLQITVAGVRVSKKHSPESEEWSLIWEGDWVAFLAEFEG